MCDGPYSAQVSYNENGLRNRGTSYTCFVTPIFGDKRRWSLAARKHRKWRLLTTALCVLLVRKRTYYLLIRNIAHVFTLHHLRVSSKPHSWCMPTCTTDPLLNIACKYITNLSYFLLHIWYIICIHTFMLNEKDKQ
jgi:hypothetical protein